MRFLIGLGFVFSVSAVACGSVAVSPIEGDAGAAGTAGQGGAGGASGAGGSGIAASGGEAGSAGNGAGGSAGAGVNNPTCDPPTGHNTNFSVVACGFGPSMALIGVDGDSIFVMTARGGGTKSFFRVDKKTGERKLLHKSIISSGADPRDALGGVRLYRQMGPGHQRDIGLYFANHLDFQGGVTIALQRLSGSSGGLSTAFDGGNMSGFLAPILLHDDHVFFTESGGSFLRRGKLDSFGGAVDVTNRSGDALHAAGGFVYFASSRSIWRAPITGGDAQEIAPGAYVSGLKVRRDLAFDDSYVYFPEEGEFLGTHYIKRVPLAGGQAETVLEIPDQESGTGASFVRLDGENLYFIRFGLERVKKGGGEPELVGHGTDLSPPVFDSGTGGYGYTAVKRGGDDQPIEGAIYRFRR